VLIFGVFFLFDFSSQKELLQILPKESIKISTQESTPQKRSSMVVKWDP
jgi:hypothetical protein